MHKIILLAIQKKLCQYEVLLFVFTNSFFIFYLLFFWLEGENFQFGKVIDRFWISIPVDICEDGISISWQNPRMIL
jgi:hypothetical protein